MRSLTRLERLIVAFLIVERVTRHRDNLSWQRRRVDRTAARRAQSGVVRRLACDEGCDVGGKTAKAVQPRVQERVHPRPVDTRAAVDQELAKPGEVVSSPSVSSSI